MNREKGFFIELGLITGLMFGFELVEDENDDWILIIDLSILRLMFSNRTLS